MGRERMLLTRRGRRVCLSTSTSGMGGEVPKTASSISEPRARQVAALPWRVARDGGIEVLLVTSRSNRKWMLPKGWTMDGKSDADAAAQEALEEAGVEGEINSAPIGSYAYIKLFDDGSTKPSQAVVFSLLVTRQLRKWPERSPRRRKWFAPDEAAKRVFEPGLSRLLANLAAGRLTL